MLAEWYCCGLENRRLLNGRGGSIPSHGGWEEIVKGCAVCPGGEEAVSKTVALEGVAGSNPVGGVSDDRNERGTGIGDGKP